MSEPVLREWYIILKSVDDLEDFYNDMETPGGNLYIPNRAVECVDRRCISRVTHYMLTDDEAALIAQDPRVEAVELNYEDNDMKISPASVQKSQTSSNWDKSQDLNANMLNWGLVRCSMPAKPTLTSPNVYPEQVYHNYSPGTRIATGINYLDTYNRKLYRSQVSGTPQVVSNLWDIYFNTSGQPIFGSSWGYNPVDTNYYQKSINYTTNINLTGKNVDVVVVDGGIVPKNHPEFALNDDGSGGTRCIEYNWYQHNQELGFGTNGTYSYDSSKINGHATHVTGTVAGNRQGWAKEANIYNLSYNENSARLFDYVRAFHRNKQINPATGRKNPTVVNCSFGFFYPAITLTNLVSVTINNTTTQKPISGWSKTTLYNLGIVTDSSNDKVPIRSAAMDADIVDAIAEGIIIVCAAGNSGYAIYGSDRTEYNYSARYTANFSGQTTETRDVYYLRGTSPGNAASESTRFQIGALDSTPWDAKTDFSCCGDNVDFYAPGNGIISAYTNEANYVSAIPDPRNSQYYLQKNQGTSMASPQVAGMIACLAEYFPTWKAAQFKEYLYQSQEFNDKLTQAAGSDPFVSSGGSYSGNYWYRADLQIKDSTKLASKRISVVAKFKNPRTTTGVTYPNSLGDSRINSQTESQNTIIYPRRKSIR